MRKPKCGLYLFDGKYVWVFGGQCVRPTEPADTTWISYRVLSSSEPGASGEIRYAPAADINKFKLLRDCGTFEGLERDPAW